MTGFSVLRFMREQHLSLLSVVLIVAVLVTAVWNHEAITNKTGIQQTPQPFRLKIMPNELAPAVSEFYCPNDPTTKHTCTTNPQEGDTIETLWARHAVELQAAKRAMCGG